MKNLFARRTERSGSRRARQSAAAVMSAAGLVLTVMAAPSLAAAEGAAEPEAPAILTLEQCRDRYVAKDAGVPIGDEGVDHRAVLQTERDQARAERERAAEAARVEQERFEQERLAREQAAARANAQAAADDPPSLPTVPTDLPTPTLPTLPTPSIPTPSEPVPSPTTSLPPVPSATPRPTTRPRPSTPAQPTPPAQTFDVSPSADPTSAAGGAGGGDEGDQIGSVAGRPEGTVAAAGSCGTSVACQSVAAATVTSPTTTDGLPDTGAPDDLGLLAAGLVLLGGGAFLLRPRRGLGRHRLAL